MSARYWTAPALWRLGKGRGLDVRQSSLKGPTGAQGESGTEQPQSKTLLCVAEAREFRKPFGA